FDDVDVAVFAGAVDLAVGGDRRGAEGTSRAAEALLVDLLAAGDLVRRQRAVALQDVEIVAVDHRRRDVGTAALRAPDDELVLGLVVLERDVAGRAGLERDDRLDGAIPVGDDDEARADDRRRDRDLRVARILPQLLAGHRVVAAGEGRGLGDQLRLAVYLEDRRRGPRRDLVTLRAPDLLASGRVERGEERAALNVALHDHHVLVDDRRAADAPLVVGIEEPAGVEDPEVLLPELLAFEVERVEPLRTERHDDVPAVGDRRRRCLARLGVPLRLRDAFGRDAVPDDLARSLVERDEMPGVLRGVGDRLDVAVLAGADALLGIAADRGGDEDAVAPDDRARHGDAVHRRLPRDVLTRRRLPLHRGRLAVGDARGIGAAERWPVLSRRGRAGGDDRERKAESTPHCFPSTRVEAAGGVASRASAKPVTLSPSTCNVRVIGAPIPLNFFSSVAT